MSADPGVAVSRRDRLRAEMLASIRELAYAQLAEGGAESLSLNAIAKALGVSGPALYRYFASRDELLAELVTESWEDLATTLENTAAAARSESPRARFLLECRAYRSWALENPHRYRLLNGTTFGTGGIDPERIVPAAHRTMLVVLASFAELASGRSGEFEPVPELAAQLRQWAASRPSDPGLDPDVLLRGILAQTRIHGIISLEIEGYFAQLGLDPQLIFDREVDALLA